ncbi:MAG: tripartite tricarboxylate transporter substrate binding protein [Alcaligenaceae bacterium]|nr:MAG: tripartite tricarboxylate transporter substrate binding protein [Alcaligenaceae bacterium]
MFRKISAHIVRALALLFIGFAAQAQTAPWPTKPIHLIISTPAGGGMDALARIIGEEITAKVKQPVIVESKTGANGTVSAEWVARAPPDGYTLLLVTNAQLTVNPHLQKMRFDPLTDLRHISQITLAQNMLVIRPQLKINTLPELISYAKANPGKLNYGSSGNGSLQHIGAELFQRMTGTKFTHIAYKGGLPARLDLLAGNIDLMFADMGTLPAVNAGQLKAIAVTGAARDPAAPNLPTLSELGLKGYAVEGYYLLSAPAQTPDAIVRRLEEIVTEMLKKPEVIERIQTIFHRPATDSSSKYVNQLLRRDYGQYGKLIQDFNIRTE